MKKCLLFSLWMWLPWFSCFGQTPYFQQYFLLRKNEPVKTNVIFQDQSGIIWFGTDKGLFRFDGVKQVRYTIAQHLPDDNVTAIAQDGRGRIWTGHKNGRLSIIEKGKVTLFEPPEGSSLSEVSDILFDKHDNLWFSTLGDGLYYMAENRLFRLDETDHMPDVFIYDIDMDNTGNIWAGTDAGAAICTLQGKKVSIKTLNSDNGLPDDIIRKIAVGPEGWMWLGTEDAGIIRYNPATENHTPLFTGTWQNGAIVDFLFSGNQVWISVFQKGLFVYDLASKQIKKYETRGSIGAATINTLIEDHEGNIWTGSMNGIKRSAGDYLGFVESLEPAKDLNVLAIASDKNGNTWFSNSEGLFMRTLDKDGNARVEKKIGRSTLKNSSIISLCADEQGYIWAGLYGDGVIRLNPANGNIRQIKSELRDGNILNITCRGNTIWLATLGGASKISINGEHLNIKNYSRQNGLIPEYIYQVFIDSRNRVWFATDGNGIAMLDHAGFHFYRSGLDSKVIYGFAEDGLHRIWANVQGSGPYIYNNASFQPVTARNNLKDYNINCLSSDKSGNIILMHDLGIEIFDIKKNKYIHLGDQFGIHDKKPNLNAVTKDKEGRVLFGTESGIIVYADCSNTRNNNPVPFIDDFNANNKSQDLSKSQRLKYDENDVTIHFGAFWYQNADNLRFMYKLENYDRNWISSRNFSTTYSSLPPGTYVFRLKASDSDEFLDSKEISMEFRISPPFWQTPFFYIFSSITAILVAFSFLKYRERTLRHDKSILETKNRELQKMNMELDKFVYSVSHDLRAPLLSMKGVVDITGEETNDAMIVENMKMLSGSINRLDNFIGEILEFSRNARTDVKKDVIDFRQLIVEIMPALQDLNLGANPVKIQTEVKGKGILCNDRARVSLILHNLAVNAIQYHNPSSSTPFVKIQVNVNDNEALLEVEDNGIGIRKDYHDKIFDMFSRFSENSVGPGLGLYNVKEALDKINGTISVTSEPDKGTKMSLRIPNLFYQ